MSLAITGNQFLDNGGAGAYTVTGIGAGYTLDSVVLPSGWTIDSDSGISAGTEDFVFNVGIGSGTIIIIYVNAGNYKSVFYDVYSGANRMGEEIMRDAVSVPTPPLPIIPIIECEEDCPKCPFVLNVFADINDIHNDLKNDKSDFYGLKYMGNAGISQIDIWLQRNDSDLGYCDWVDKYLFVEPVFPPEHINNLTSPYGLYFGFGHSPNFTNANFTDDFGNRYTGLLLYWLTILQTWGEGQYRIKIVYTSAIDGSQVTDYDERIFCLHQWNCHNINGTIRIETTNIGLRGTLNNKKIQIDYFSGWYGQIRLKGIFKQESPSNNREYNQYGDADFNSFKPIIDEQIPKYKLQIKPIPGWIDWYLSTNILQADEILITDYNSKSRHIFVKVPVKDGTFQLLEETYYNPYAIAELKFVYGQNNLRRRNSI